MSLKEKIIKMAKDAKRAAKELVNLSSSLKDKALSSMAKALIKNASFILKENKKDISLAKKKGKSLAFLDRLQLDEKRINEMSQCLIEIAKLKDPIGEVIRAWIRPNGLCINKVRTALGVVAIIYESRPNVTSDCIGLCLKSGNALILRGGSEAINSNLAIYKTLIDSIKGLAVPQGAINMVRTTQRKAVDILLKQEAYIDLIIPRGGEGLIREVSKKSRIPVIKHYKGICHTYVDKEADLDLAKRVCFNAKVQKPGVCNAMETLLVHKDIARLFIPEMVQQFKEAGVEVRGCRKTHSIVKNIKKAQISDWKTEYLDLILSVKVVDSLEEAIGHISKYGSRHSDAIITRDYSCALDFLRKVDSACVYVNTSTRFSDGYQFGLGAEMGISTDKLHARGPMALEELTTYKYIVFGSGQIRTG